MLREALPSANTLKTTESSSGGSVLSRREMIAACLSGTCFAPWIARAYEETSRAPDDVWNMTHRAGEMRKITQELETIWRKQNGTLTECCASMNNRLSGVKMALQGRQVLAEKFYGAWQPSVTKFHDHEKISQIPMDDYFMTYRGLAALLTTYEQQLNIATDQNALDHLDVGYRKIAHQRYPLERRHKELLMTDATGKRWGLYPEELEENPALTAEEYLDALGNVLRSPEELALFFRYFFAYTYDSPNPEDPLEKGTKERNGEYWQTPWQTVRRVKEGKMLGDCDDLALLARAILQRHGTKTFVITIPDHMLCTWIEREKSGLLTGRSLCTLGLDRNGRRFGVASNDMIVSPTYRPYSSGKDEGYRTPEDALASVLEKYRNNPQMKDAMRSWNFQSELWMVNDPLPGHPYALRSCKVNRFHEMVNGQLPEVPMKLSNAIAPPPPAE